MKYYIFFITTLLYLISCNSDNNRKKIKKKFNENNDKISYSFEYKNEVFSYNDCDSKNKECTYIELQYPQFDYTGTYLVEFLKGWTIDQVISTLLYNESVTDISTGVEAYFDYFNNFKEEMKEAGEPVNTWHLKGQIEVLYHNNTFFTIKTTKTSFENLDTPIRTVNLNTIYLPTYNFVALEEMIVNKSALHKLVEKKFRKKNNMSDEDDFEEKGYWFEEFEITYNVGVLENGLLMIYDYSEIAPAEMGSTEIFLSFEELEGIIDLEKAIQTPTS